MKLSVIISLCLTLGLTHLNGQQLIDEEPFKTNMAFGEITFFNTDEVSYQVNIISGLLDRLAYQLYFRLEDELTTDGNYILLNDVTFLDFQFIYDLGKLQLAFFVENLLGFNDSAFAIEPNLERHLNVADTVYFSHEANFLLGVSVVYNF